MKSMTGYGKSELQTMNRRYLVEIKSINHKYTDISIKMPRAINFLEENVRRAVASSISRGKIDVVVTYQNIGENTQETFINESVAKGYIEALKKIAKETQIEKNINLVDILQLPDVLVLKPETKDADLIWSELSGCLDDAIENFLLMRQIEGNKIKEDLEKRVQALKKDIEQIHTYTNGLMQEYVVKLEEKIKEYAKVEEVDMARISQEIVIYADKISIEEELTRLESHIEQLASVLEEEGSIGKKADFLIQEMNRESNTIGAKSAKIEITNAVINLKTKLEDIREQIQNIE